MSSAANTARRKALQTLPLVGLLILLFAIIIALPNIRGHVDDAAYWSAWAGYIKENGLRKAYGSGTDYPPLYQYVLWAYAKLCGSREAIGQNIAYLRLFTLFFDLAGVWLLARWIGRPHQWILLTLLSLLNLAYSYNTVVWGQVDGILATLLFAAIACAWHRRLLQSAALFALAFSFKLQAVVLLPLWALAMLASAAGQRRWRRLGGSLFVFVAVTVLVCAPFLLTPESRQGLYNAYFGSVGRHPYASMIAGNMWYWIIDTNPRWTLDSHVWFAGLTYKRAGVLLFCILSVPALWPMARSVFKAVFYRHSNHAIPRAQLWLTAALLVILFFFCNTEMHSRYAHPAMIFLTAHAFYTRDFLPYILASVAYLLNLEKANEWMFQDYDRFLFDGRVIAGLWAAVIVSLFARLWGWKKVTGQNARRDPTTATDPAQR